MTNEEKELLLQDLCARLPYGVMFYYDNNEPLKVEGVVCNIVYFKAYNYQTEGDESYADITECKPYLRPMSSMTEEEKKEFIKVLVKSQDCSCENNESATTIVNDWYLSKGFDVRGLIPKGLALEAPEDMYK